MTVSSNSEMTSNVPKAVFSCAVRASASFGTSRIMALTSLNATGSEKRTISDHFPRGPVKDIIIMEISAARTTHT